MNNETLQMLLEIIQRIDTQVEHLSDEIAVIITKLTLAEKGLDADIERIRDELGNPNIKKHRYVAVHKLGEDDNMPDDVTTVLANFFYEAWEHYREEPTEDIEALLANCPLVEEHEITAEDVKDEVYDGEEGDTVFVLSEMGKLAWSMAS